MRLQKAWVMKHGSSSPVRRKRKDAIHLKVEVVVVVEVVEEKAENGTRLLGAVAAAVAPLVQDRVIDCSGVVPIPPVTVIMSTYPKTLV